MDWVNQVMDVPLGLYLLGGENPTDALVRWIDGSHVHAVTRQQQRLEEPRRAYLDVQPQGRQVEIEIRFTAISRPPGGSTRGWVHRGTWRVVEDADRVWLDAQLPHVNPAMRIERLNPSTPSRSRWSRGRSRSSTTSGGDTLHKKRSRPRAPHTTAYSPPEANQPASLLVRLTDSEELARSILLDSGGFRLTLVMASPLQEGQELMLALQLPGQSFLQVEATVTRVRGRRVRLEAVLVDRSDFALLQVALG